MKYQGLHPATRLARWGLVAIGFGIVIGGTAPSAIRELAVAWEANRAVLPWVVERLFAFLGYGAMAGSVIYGLLLSTKILDAIAHRPITFTLHQDLAAIGLGLGAVHGALLALDRTMPFTAAQIAIPGLAPYAPVAVGLGQSGCYLMVIVIASFYARRRIGQRTWRALHYLTFLAFAAVTLHGVLAGSDSATLWATAIYGIASLLVGVLLAFRIATAVHDRRERVEAPEGGLRRPVTAPS